MKTFKEYINEGTSASITVLTKQGLYKTSFLQYDALTAIKYLKHDYASPEMAETLVAKSGEIRDIYPLEYYTDRTILEITKDIEKAIANSNEMHIKYFFDGKKWNMSKGQISSFDEMKKL